jgi:hypothetical protein
VAAEKEHLLQQYTVERTNGFFCPGDAGACPPLQANITPKPLMVSGWSNTEKKHTTEPPLLRPGSTPTTESPAKS